MKLYGNPGSTCTRKVLTTLAEKGASADFVEIDLAKGEQKSAEHRKHQPFGVVPALDDNGFEMFESRAIIRYLDDTLPGPKLTPSDPKQKAKMEQWTSVEYSYFTPHAMKIIYQKLLYPMRGMATDMKVVDDAKAELGKTLDIMERELGRQPFLAGEQFSLADISYMPYIEYLFAGQEGELIQSRPHVAMWWKRISERPSWQKVTGKA